MENNMAEFSSIPTAGMGVSEAKGDGMTSKSFKPDVESVPIRLFVGRVPPSAEETEVQAVFEEQGPVLECQIIRQKGTGAHKNSAFVKMSSLTDADRAIRNYHNKRTFAGQHGPMQVKYANGEVERLGLTNESVDPEHDEGTLFVGSIPRTLDSAGLKEKFSPFGEIATATVLKDVDGSSRGCGFIKFCYKEQAVQAKDALNGKLVIEGANRPVDIRFATDKGKFPTPYGGQLASQGGSSQNISTALGQAVPGLTQAQQLALASILSNPSSVAALASAGQPQQQAMMQGLNSSAAAGLLATGKAQACPWREITLPDGNTYYHNQLTNVTTWQRPPEMDLGSPQGANLALLGQGQLGMQSLQTQSPTGSHNGPASAQLSLPSMIPQGVPGPPGANVFLFHIPHDWQQADVVTHFAPYGKIVSVTVPLDPKTGVTNRGFAFLGYDDVQSAVSAVTHMNGFMVGNKRLKVTIKKGEEEHAAPFLKATQNAVSESSMQ